MYYGLFNRYFVWIKFLSTLGNAMPELKGVQIIWNKQKTSFVIFL